MALLVGAACADNQDPSQTAGGHDKTCPAVDRAPVPLPGTSQAERTLEYWLDKYDPEQLDTPILSPTEIAEYNDQHRGEVGKAHLGQHDLRQIPAPEALAHEVAERLDYMRTRLQAGALFPDEGAPAPELAEFEQSLPAPTTLDLRVALRDVPLRCGPYPLPLHKSAEDDMDRNACGLAHPQEVIQLLAQAQKGMWLVRTRYALGFIELAEGLLSPPLPPSLHDTFIVGPRLSTRKGATVFPDRVDAVTLPAHTSVPLYRQGRILVATADGIHGAAAPSEWTPSHRPLTRRALLTEAFAYLGEPYGLGGQDGGRDCSRLLLDLFESFHLALPRHSSWQAQAGTGGEDIPEDLTAAQRIEHFEAANEHGVVLLSFPGHIMLYLGRGKGGAPMALHSLGEYVRPCNGGGETILNVRQVVVSDLSLGKGSSRRSLLERVTRVTVFASDKPPVEQLAMPSAKACHKASHAPLFVSPEIPRAEEATRFIHVGRKPSDPSAIQRLTLWGPGRNQLAQSTAAHFGGPPFGYLLQHTPSKPGLYTVGLTSGDELLSCSRLRVRGADAASTPPAVRRTETPATWPLRRRWGRTTEDLWSVFVESLFDFPEDDETTWDDLHTLLRDPQRNLLFNHLGLDEDAHLELQPDCADLPYMLRAYFSWKLGLPFTFRICNRGRPGSPPACPTQVSAQRPSERPDPVRAFEFFASRTLRSGVHSASGRTAPTDSDTDLYPIALRRETLTPGTVYADPYGHVMMLSKWYPQNRGGQETYGILMASEAQPDGTIGRRRFWEGAFLFEPDTTHVGAGFKHFRPVVVDRETGEPATLDNAALRNNPFGADYSQEQYSLTKDGFYDRMDALINPDPLDPIGRQNALIDALEESVRRRVESVDNAIQYFNEGGQRPITMPAARGLFQTTGPWEDYSTPSRDMRLLISIDTVVKFPERVAKHPERYAGGAADPQALQKALETSLQARSFTYTRSDGQPQELTLLDLVKRRKQLEMAYNPNDCIEVRWGAPRGSDEHATCTQRAPREQLQRMSSYRKWFAERRRPQPGEQ